MFLLTSHFLLSSQHDLVCKVIEKHCGQLINLIFDGFFAQLALCSTADFATMKQKDVQNFKRSERHITKSCEFEVQPNDHSCSALVEL